MKLSKEVIKQTVLELKNQLYSMSSGDDREYYIIMGRLMQLCCEGHINQEQYDEYMEQVTLIKEYVTTGYSTDDVIASLLTFLEIDLNK